MVTYDEIVEHWEIRFRDIDPDTGLISRDIPMAITTIENYADLIAETLQRADESPNREYYVLHRLKRKI